MKLLNIKILNIEHFLLDTSGWVSQPPHDAPISCWEYWGESGAAFVMATMAMATHWPPAARDNDDGNDDDGNDSRDGSDGNGNDGNGYPLLQLHLTIMAKLPKIEVMWYHLTSSWIWWCWKRWWWYDGNDGRNGTRLMAMMAALPTDPWVHVAI